MSDVAAWQQHLGKLREQLRKHDLARKELVRQIELTEYEIERPGQYSPTERDKQIIRSAQSHKPNIIPE